MNRRPTTARAAIAAMAARAAARPDPLCCQYRYPSGRRCLALGLEPDGLCGLHHGEDTPVPLPGGAPC